ncbi:type IV toxin-antitoxin system AbiEi family antitoxin domain-containing protein [Gordonia sp. DT101]|uniref:type IV toxin-antitoxin system AbiEi family antitoxin domain-containing protein n=1 Tax=Gordonia sp. DT101 TaxID=3416545 RepID=UPI003CF26D45
MTVFPTDRHGLVHRLTALASGFTDTDLVRAQRCGELIRVISGVYAVAAERTPEQLHRLRAIAVLASTEPDHTLSHQSAATLHDLPMLTPNLRRVHVTTGSRSGGHRSTARHAHVGTLTPAEVETVDGVRVTSVERTAVDIACTSTMGFAGALAVFDAALRRGADRELMSTMLGRRRRGITQARRALLHADPGAENPGESWGRAQMIEAGLPVPRLQHEFHDADGNLVARTDYDWSALLVGEFDGDVKYRKHLRPDETPFDAMKREKEREDALRRLGIMVVRWTWKDLEKGRVVGLIREWLARLQLIAA